MLKVTLCENQKGRSLSVYFVENNIYLLYSACGIPFIFINAWLELKGMIHHQVRQMLRSTQLVRIEVC
jgi:hypothetical protein